MLQKLRPSPLRFLNIDENPREPSNPAVLIIGGRWAPRLNATHQTENRQQTPCGVHCAYCKSHHVRLQSRQSLDIFGSWLLGVDRHEMGPVLWFYWCQLCHNYAPTGGGDPAVRKVSRAVPRVSALGCLTNIMGSTYFTNKINKCWYSNVQIMWIYTVAINTFHNLHSFSSVIKEKATMWCVFCLVIYLSAFP